MRAIAGGTGGNALDARDGSRGGPQQPLSSKSKKNVADRSCLFDIATRSRSRPRLIPRSLIAARAAAHITYYRRRIPFMEVQVRSRNGVNGEAARRGPAPS